LVNSSGGSITVDSIPDAESMMGPEQEGVSTLLPDFMGKEYIVTFVLKKIYDEVADIMVDSWMITQLKPAPEPPVKKEKMKLIDVQCESDVCLYSFTNAKSDTVFSNDSLFDVIPITEDETGRMYIKPENLGKTYLVTYTTKKVKDYGRDVYIDFLVITKIEPVKE
jgi:hypothetical protein